MAPKLTLNDGKLIPQLGFGVWKASAGECYNAVRTALDVGYRHIDTARIYGNEADVGRAIKESGIAREEIFVTTKLWNSDQNKPEKAFADSLARLDCGYVDLYLVHFPVTATRAAAYAALEKIHATGAARSIGVSNYMPSHLKELLATCSVPPVVNQIEVHPWLAQKELKALCAEKNIIVQAYSPLAHGQKTGDAALAPIAQKHKKSIAQILLRWSIEMGNVVLVKSVSAQRIAENFAIFDFALDADDMKILAGLDSGLRTCWDPSATP